MHVLISGLQAGNRSGTGRYTSELIKHLPTVAPDIDLTILWPKDGGATHTAANVVPVEIARPLDRFYKGGKALYEQVAQSKPDLIHYPANIRSWASTRPYVVTIHDLSFYRNPMWYRANRAVYYWLTVRRSARRARRIIVDSKSTADDLIEMLKLPRDRIDVVYLGVGDEFQPATQEQQAAVCMKYKLPEKFFLFVGTLEPRKNLPNVIKAWSLIARECSVDLVIAGRSGWKTGSIFDAAASSPYIERIHFIDYVPQEELPALLSSAHVFVWPSLCEGFGLPPLEAMACGTPVVTSNLSCLPEIVGDAAFQVDPYDPEDIAKAMFDLATTPALLDRFQKRGFEQARKYTWEKTAKLTAETYRRAAKHP